MLWLVDGARMQAGSVLVAVDVSFQSPPDADAFVDSMRCCARQTFACVLVCLSAALPVCRSIGSTARARCSRLIYENASAIQLNALHRRNSCYC